ncbi:hypothetical protein [Litorimonas sp.]|uniref:hypothetical protein n=1 Tax=Litorimonas sp. TaxID=1892381 RepID=UPI003A8BD912
MTNKEKKTAVIGDVESQNTTLTAAIAKYFGDVRRTSPSAASIAFDYATEPDRTVTQCKTHGVVEGLCPCFGKQGGRNAQ